MSQAAYVRVLLIVMVAAGLLGGVASFLIARRKGEAKDQSIFGYLVLGVVASLIVPLLLNMISSDLLRTAKGDYLRLLPFGGFCLIAAVFSRRFLESIYSRVMQKVGKLETEVEDLKEVASEPETPGQEPTSEELSKADVSDDDYQLMHAMSSGKYLYRSLGGLAKETSLPKEKINRSLNSMIAKNLIGQRSNREGKQRWYLASDGRRLLGDLSEPKKKSVEAKPSD
jgi:hypothetical protein